MNSKELAKRIVDNFCRKLPPDDVEMQLTSMLENWRIQEINLWANSKNLEAALKNRNEQPLPKQDIPGVERVKVWSRR